MTAPKPVSFAELVDWRLPPAPIQEAHGTTVLALRHDTGVVLIADRRATMGNLIMYEQAEKIVPLDDTTVVAVSGSFARSLEVCRYLRHAFKYYERMNLVKISAEGKLAEISRALAGNLPAAAEGVGLFLPICAAYDETKDSFGVYFFDAAGARFLGSDYACAGSGSERIRGVFEYLARTKGPWSSRPFEDVLADGLAMLEIAAELDSATGGFQATLPSCHRLDRNGVHEVGPETLQPLLPQSRRV